MTSLIHSVKSFMLILNATIPSRSPSSKISSTSCETSDSGFFSRSIISSAVRPASEGDILYSGLRIFARNISKFALSDSSQPAIFPRRVFAPSNLQLFCLSAAVKLSKTAKINFCVEVMSPVAYRAAVTIFPRRRERKRARKSISSRKFAYSLK